MYGERIKEKRKEFGLSRKELALKLMYPPQVIKSWEEEKLEPTIDDFARLAEYFETSVEFLMGTEDEHDCEICDGFFECKLIPHMHHYIEENDGAGYVHIQLALNEDGEDALIYSGSTEAVLCAANLLLDSVATEVGMDYFDLVSMMATLHAKGLMEGNE